MNGTKNWITPLMGAVALLCATGTAVAASGSSRWLSQAKPIPASRSIDGRGSSDVHLAARILRTHKKGRNQTGENLWMGTAGHWQVETMVGMFIAEKKHYRHAHFPNISKTGNWADVGHYSQVVWRDTQEVGCAVATAAGNDVLVCRYWPAGNVWGQKAY